jgi:hypothetical protein
MNAVEQLLLGSLVLDFKTMDMSHPDITNRTMHEVLTNQTIFVPQDCGIMIELRSSDDLFDENSKDGLVLLHTSVSDATFDNIHPHCHAPADLRDVHSLHGGGSGTAVFYGSSDSLGSIVMKHGGAKDAQEVFSLIAIRQELVRRAMFQQQLLSQEARAAARRMQQKIPEFVMAYISPFHTRNRNKELWASLRFGLSRSTSRADFCDFMNESDRKNGNIFRSTRTLFRSKGTLQSTSGLPNNSVRFTNKRFSTFSKRMSTAEKNEILKEERSQKRSLRVRVGEDAENRWIVDDSAVEIIINSGVFAEDKKENDCFVLEDGIDGLIKFASCIRNEIAEHSWKMELTL